MTNIDNNFQVISPAVVKGWDHKKKFWVPHINDFLICSNVAKLNKFISIFEVGGCEKSKAAQFLRDYKYGGRSVLPLSVGVFLVWKAFARSNDLSYKNLSVQLNDVTMHNIFDVGDCVRKVDIGIVPKSGEFQASVDGVFFLSGKTKQHGPLKNFLVSSVALTTSVTLKLFDQYNVSSTGKIEAYDMPLECGEEFSNSSPTIQDHNKLLAFHAMASPSNSLINKLDTEDYSCSLGEPESILHLIDAHFQLLQLEQQSVTEGIAV